MSKTISKAWQAGHSQDIETGDVTLPDMCQELGQWIKNEDPRMRTSLGNSSVLIDGAARIYKQKTELLFKDIAKLDIKMITRNRNNSDADEDNNKSSQSPLETSPTPEDKSNAPVENNVSKSSSGMPNNGYSFTPYSEDSSDHLISSKSLELQCSETSNSDWETVKTQDDTTKESATFTTNNPSSTQDNKQQSSNPCENFTNSSETSTSLSKSKKRSSTEKNDTTESSPKRRAFKGQETEMYKGFGRLSSTEQRSRKSLTRTSHEDNEDDGIAPGETSSSQSIILVSSKVEVTHKGKEKRATQRKDDETQTDITLDIKDIREGLNTNLPYGCLMIYENSDSKIPFKILFTSLSPSVLDLV